MLVLIGAFLCLPLMRERSERPFSLSLKMEATAISFDDFSNGLLFHSGFPLSLLLVVVLFIFIFLSLFLLLCAWLCLLASAWACFCLLVLDLFDF